METSSIKGIFAFAANEKIVTRSVRGQPDGFVGVIDGLLEVNTAQVWWVGKGVLAIDGSLPRPR